MLEPMDDHPTGPDAGPDPGRVIDVFADVVCPFTHVGLRRLVAERTARGRGDVVLAVKAWPLELVNGRPLEASFVAEEVRALQVRVAADLFAGFDPQRWPGSSLPALALTAAARRAGPRVAEAVALAVRTALFEDGLDVADPGVLGQIAAAHGVDPFDVEAGREQVEAEWQEGRDRGVIGSPHFFVGETDVFCPTLRISHTEGRFDIEVATVELGAFMDRCFA